MSAKSALELAYEQRFGVPPPSTAAQGVTQVPSTTREQPTTQPMAPTSNTFDKNAYRNPRVEPSTSASHVSSAPSDLISPYMSDSDDSSDGRDGAPRNYCVPGLNYTIEEILKMRADTGRRLPPASVLRGLLDYETSHQDPKQTLFRHHAVQLALDEETKHSISSHTSSVINESYTQGQRGSKGLHQAEIAAFEESIRSHGLSIAALGEKVQLLTNQNPDAQIKALQQQVRFLRADTTGESIATNASLATMEESMLRTLDTEVWPEIHRLRDEMASLTVSRTTLRAQQIEAEYRITKLEEDMLNYMKNMTTPDSLRQAAMAKGLQNPDGTMSWSTSSTPFRLGDKVAPPTLPVLPRSEPVGQKKEGQPPHKWHWTPPV